MVVCKFFLQGNCRNGDDCRFEHPAARNTGFQNPNRFSPLGNRSGSNSGNEVRKDNSWNINTTEVRNDLTEGKGRPNWILSTYGPGKNVPASLLEGNEYSPEEIRLRFYELASNGNEAQADQEAIQLWTNCEQAIKDIANNVDNVIKFMELSNEKQPNRYDFCKTDGTRPIEQAVKASQSGTAFGGSSSSAFGGGTGFGQVSDSSNPFIKPAASAFGQPSSAPAFGATGFGQTPQPASTGFGQQPSAPAFGSTGFGQPSQPSAFGGSTTFGKPALGGAGFGQAAIFGKPATTGTAFGQTSQPPSTFGQPAQATGFGTSGFGQTASKNPLAAPSAAGTFGQASQSAPAFGQSSQPTSTFGKPSQGGSAFGQSSQSTLTFAQSQPPSGFAEAQGNSIFGQPSTTKPALGPPSQATSNLGQTSQTASPFGESSAFAQAGTFGKPAFGQSSKPTTNAFGQPVQTSTSPFGQPTAVSAPTFGAALAPSNPFGPPSTTASINPFDATANAGSTTFGQSTQRATSFGQPAQQSSTTSNPFAQAPAAAPTGPSSTLRKASNATPDGPHPLTQKPARPLHYTETLPDALSKLDMQRKTYRGRRVQNIDSKPCYERPDRKGWERIWFPQGADGPEVVVLNNAEKTDQFQGKDGDYTDMVKEEYKYLFEEGRFREGNMPLVPPIREWCLYDF